MDDPERKAATAASFGASAAGYRDSDTHRAGEDLDRLASWCGGATRALEDNVVPADDAVAAVLNRLERTRDPTHVESYRTATWHGWLRTAGFDVVETDHVVRRIEVGPWIERAEAPDAGGEAEVRRVLADVPEAVGVEYDDAGVVAFGSRKALVRAELRDR
ncbi:MAG: hypothetical protein V5A82_05800 [Haloferacaceae archaeon]